MRGLIMKWRLKRLMRKANKQHAATGYKYYVILWRGRPELIRKQAVKQMLKDKVFGRGVTIRILENKALYVSK